MDIYEGPQYKIRKINWDGNTVYPSYALSERLDFAPGDVYNLEKFEQNLRVMKNNLMFQPCILITVI